MTNKEKILAEIERLRKNLPWGGSAVQMTMECNCKNEAYTEIEKFINSIPEEPVSEQKLSNVERTVKNWKESVSEIDFEQELYKAFGHVKDFTLCLKIAKRFYNMGRNYQEPVSEELEKVVEEIVDPTVLNAYGTKELARRLRNTICGTSVSEELEEAAREYADNEEYGDDVYFAIKAAFKDGAKWQKEQMMKNAKEGILENDDFYGYVKLTGSRVDKEQENKEVKVIIILED